MVVKIAWLLLKLTGLFSHQAFLPHTWRNENRQTSLDKAEPLLNCYWSFILAWRFFPVSFGEAAVSFHCFFSGFIHLWLCCASWRIRIRISAAGRCLLWFGPAPAQMGRKPSYRDTFVVQFLCLSFGFGAWGHSSGWSSLALWDHRGPSQQGWRPSALGSEDEGIIQPPPHTPFSALLAYISWPISFSSIHSW